MPVRLGPTWAYPTRITLAGSSSTRVMNERVYVAAIGHRHSRNRERGVCSGPKNGGEFMAAMLVC